MVIEMKSRICEKYMLNVFEASDYFGIGEKKLRSILSYRHDLGTMVGTKLLINRKKFERFLDETEAV